MVKNFNENYLPHLMRTRECSQTRCPHFEIMQMGGGFSITECYICTFEGRQRLEILTTCPNQRRHRKFLKSQKQLLVTKAETKQLTLSDIQMGINTATKSIEDGIT